MNRFTAKRLVTVLLGIVLPVAVVVGLLAFSMQHSYLQAADSFGQEFGQMLTSQAQATVELVVQENWNTANTAALALQGEFLAADTDTQAARLAALAKVGDGRYGVLFYYDQNGSYVGSNGTSGTMHYTSRTDISAILAGSQGEILYGPQFEDDAENETSNVSTADQATERSGYVMYYTVPVKNAAGAIVGALSLRRDAYQLSDALSSLSLGEAGYTCLLNESGTVIAVSREEYKQLISEETNLTTLAGGYGQAAQSAVEGGRGELESQDEALGEALVVYRALTPTTQEAAASTDTAADTAAQTGTAPAAETATPTGTAGWSVLCYLPMDDLEGYLQSEANGDLLGSVTTRLAVLLLIALAVFYLIWDAVRATKFEATRQAREHKDVLEQTLRAMAAASESRDVPNKGHGYRVAAYAREIGKHMNLTPEQEQNLYFEAALHDIGKLAVPGEILRHDAENKLTADEGRRLREHVTLGGRILGRLTALPGINAGAMYHHQHYDGTGYCSADVSPLKGEDIPLSARIIAVADSYDEQASRGRTGLEAMLEDGKGSQFDPMIADIMIQLIHDGTIENVTHATNRTMRSDSAELAEV